MVFSVKSALVFRLRITPTFTTHGKEDAWGQILRFLETPQGGEKVFQALTSSPTGKIVIAELSLGVSRDLDPALRRQEERHPRPRGPATHTEHDRTFVKL